MAAYIDINGEMHHLDDEIANVPWEVERLDQIYAKRAKEISHSTGKDVFYSLKLVSTNGRGFHLVQANYFLIPLEQGESERVANQFQDKCIIGIEYQKVPIMSNSRQCY